MDIEKLKSELNVYLESGSDKDITKARGRLIEGYKKEIKKILKKDLNEEEKKYLLVIKEELEKELEKHKIQLDARYSKEFINKKAGVLSVTSVLPNAVKIASDKVKACIDDLKNANENQDKARKRVDVLKSVGSLAGTPFVYLGKFVLDQWYAVAGIGAILYFKEHPDKLFEVVKKLFGEEASVAAEVALK